MKILIYGAGVIGQIYGGRLHAAGHTVHLLARGRNLAQLREHGIVLVNGNDARRTVVKVPVVEALEPDEAYDLVIVTVRMNQMAAVLEVLRGLTGLPEVLFMLNNPAGSHSLIEAIGSERVLLGFPGCGGALEADGTVRYVLIKEQRTTFGTVDGLLTPRLREIMKAFKAANFRVAFEPSMEDWLKTHAVFIGCVGAAIVAAGGDSTLLANRRGDVKTMIRAIREGFAALSALDVRVTPFMLKLIFSYMPSWFSVMYWRRALCTPMATVAIAPHVRAAPDEMRELARQVLSLLRQSPAPVPALTGLLTTVASP
jgi:2-dehydropantoate 2-reductase